MAGSVGLHVLLLVLGIGSSGSDTGELVLPVGCWLDMVMVERSSVPLQKRLANGVQRSA